MKSWRGLESVTISSIVNDCNFFYVVGKYCKNIISLKFTCCFGQDEAEALVKYTPNLKVLSVRNIMVNMGGLCRVLNSLNYLKVVNLCHSVILDQVDDRFQFYLIRDVLNCVDISCKLIVLSRFVLITPRFTILCTIQSYHQSNRVTISSKS
jgi:hypothetical protein